MLFAFQHDNPASYSPTPRFVTSHFLHPGPPLSFLPCSSSERFLCSACCLSHCQSGAQMRIPEVLVIAVCIFAPVCGGMGTLGCSNKKHLENGQTFFRYDGLLVIFHCKPGFKVHGNKTNSCLTEQWSRDPPPGCVGSGCSVPGLLLHGMIHVNEDGSWAEFSCNSGFRLHGPSKLYCPGHSWNGTNPVSREWDISIGQTLQIPAAHKTQQQSLLENQASSLSKTTDLTFSPLPYKQATTFISERTKNPLRNMLMSVCCLLLSQAACSAALTLLGATTANVHPATANKPQMATAKCFLNWILFLWGSCCSAAVVSWGPASPPCRDTDECAANQGLGPCRHQCTNSAGSYRCSCTSGYILARDRHGCLPECPSGYRKFAATPPENTTVPPLEGKCADIIECLEDRCKPAGLPPLYLPPWIYPPKRWTTLPGSV
ncbi:uncharacterized protein LOC144990944 isoform X2 [Oryzias latipes]